MESREARARLEDHLPQLEQGHQPRGRILLEIGPDEVLEHEERHGARDATIDDVRHVRVVEAREHPRLLYDAERRIDVEWDSSGAASNYTVKLTMEVEDKKGVLAAVSAKIAGINTNIKNMEAHTDEDRRARIDVTVEISDLKHLEKVIKSLRGVDGVLDVERAGRAS